MITSTNNKFCGYCGRANAHPYQIALIQEENKKREKKLSFLLLGALWELCITRSSTSFDEIIKEITDDLNTPQVRMFMFDEMKKFLEKKV